MPTYKVFLRGKAVNILYQHKQQFAIPLQISVDPSDFQEKEEKWIKKENPQSSDLNIIIIERLAELQRHVNRFFQEFKRYPKPKTLKGFFDKGRNGVFSFKDLWKEFGRYQTHKGDDSVGLARYSQYMTTCSHLLEYKPSTDINNIDLAYVDRFKEFLKTKKDSGVNNTKRHVTILKAFLNWAIENDRCSLREKDVRAFKAAEKECDIFFHPAHELQLLMDCDISEHPHLEVIKDDYLFQCFTGLRHSDIDSKRWFDQGGFLRMAAEKNDEEVVIPIHTVVRYVLDKYAGCNFPSLTNQQYNKGIKELGKLAKINNRIVIIKGKRKLLPGQAMPKYEVMTSHMARATFICSMIEANVHDTKIMKMTGIRKSETLKHYADVMDSTLTNDMALMEQRQNLRITHLQKVAV